MPAEVDGRRHMLMIRPDGRVHCDGTPIAGMAMPAIEHTTEAAFSPAAPIARHIGMVSKSAGKSRGSTISRNLSDALSRRRRIFSPVSASAMRRSQSIALMRSGL